MGRKSRNNNKNNQPYTQPSVSTHQPNTPIQTTEPPNKRKKRIQTVEQATQVQPPRQSVFERIGTTAPLPRQPTNKKEVKDHPSGIETRKSRRISDARKAEREQLESEPKQESIQEDRNKSESGIKRNTIISKVNPSNTVKGGKREEPRPGKPLRRNSHKQLEQKQTVKKDDFQESEVPLSSNSSKEKETMEGDTKIFQEMPKADTSPQSPAEYNVQNAEQVANESKDVGNDEIDRITSENFESDVGSTVQQQNNAVYEHIFGLTQSDHESDIAKEDVVSIQADDDYLMGIEDEDPEDPSSLGEQLADQEFGESGQLSLLRSDRNISPIPDSYKDRERIREKEHGRNKDIDNAKEISSRIRNRTTNSDDGRNSDRSYDRPSRETSIQQSHVDDRRNRLYEHRDIREREREERYNRAIATDRAHDDRNFDRDRRERERQDRYNKSLLEDKAHLDIPRRNERDRFQREFERNRNDHGSRTPNAETSSNSTIRGATSRSPSDSDKPPSRTRSPERVKREDRDLRPRDDPPRDREWLPHQDFQRDRDRMSRQRDDLSSRDRDSRIRDLSKEKELSPRELKMQDRDPMSLRRNDQMDVVFRRSDERIPNVRRLDDPRNVGVPDRNPRDPPPRDREKDFHYHRDQALRPESIRRDERQPTVRTKNETQSEPVFQDNRDKEPRQRSIQPNVITEHDHRLDKRKREDIDLNERKVYYDREQRGDANSFNQRLPDYRIRDKERDQRHREDYSPKDGNRVGVNRDQDRDLTNRKEDRVSPTHDRNVGLPDLYRPSSDHHLKEPDRRSIREYERDYGVDRYRVRDGHESRSNSVEKTDPHKHLYDRHQREPEKRMTRDIEDDQISRTNRPESTRRSDAERSAQTLMDNQRDNIRDYPQEAHMQEDKNRDPQDQFIKESKKVPVNEDEDPLPPHPWIKCKSSRNKDYYFNTQTRESQWNYPEIGKNRQAQNDSNKIIDYDSRKDEDEPRKKIRLNENGESIVANTDMNPPIGHEDKIMSVNENDSVNKEVSLKDENLFDQQSESSPRLSRNNSTFLFSPSMSQSQPSPGISAAFSPPHRSISSEYNERRFSADYGIQSSPRRGSYVGSQPHSPQMSSLRSNPGPFNRGGSVDLYDRNDGFRNDDFISNRSLGDPRNITSPSGNNNSGMSFPGSPIRSARSGMYNSFGLDHNVSPGSRRSRELPIFTQSRARTAHEDERQFYGDEQHMEVEEIPAEEVHNHEMDTDNQTTIGQGYDEQTVDEESDEDTWRPDEPVEYGTAETEPVSVFLFRRADSRMDQGGVKKKFLNPRKEYEMIRSICGGKGMHLFKHSFATSHSRRE